MRLMEGSEIPTATGTWLTRADPDLVVSDCSVATTVTFVALGIRDGAVYRPLVSIVPHAVPVHPETLQVTAVEEVPVTLAVNCWVAPAMSEAVPGDTDTDITGGAGAELPPQPGRIERNNRATENKA